jgi:uncharacterized protein (TIGR02147 family)
MSSPLPFYAQFLKSEFERRKSQNKNYSLRIFAKDLGIHAGTLSNILRGIRPFPWRYVIPVGKILKMSEIDSQMFIASIKEQAPIAAQKVMKPRKNLDVERYSTFIENWEYFAILNYFDTLGSPKNVDSIAKKFNLPVTRVESVIQQLLEFGFLTKQNGKIIRAIEPVETPNNIPSSVLRKAHCQELDLVKERMESLEPLVRDISSITFAGDAETMARAKEMIRNFRDKMSALMEGETPRDVYLLAVQLVPLTQPLTQPFQKGAAK